MAQEHPEQPQPAGRFDALEAALLQPKPFTSYGEYNRMLYAIYVRRTYKGTWGAGAEHLYRALIRALNLEHRQELLLRIAKPKRGRKQERERAERIYRLRGEGKSARKISETLSAEGENLSIEAVESYFKTRRKGRKL